VRRAAAATGLRSGVQVFGMWRDWDTHDALLDKVAASGTTWIRLDVAWCSLEEAGNGVISAWYQTRLDTMIAAARSRGLQVLMTVFCTPSWAGPNGLRLPTNTAQFTQVTSYLARRYIGQVGAYEIWNEPDCQDVGCPNGDPTAYVTVLKAGYLGIKTGNPAAVVVSGGISGINLGWLRQMYAAGAHGYFDVLGVHPYIDPANGAPSTPSAAGYTNPYRIPNVVAAHALMTSYGDGAKPIWFTEFGWTTGRTAGPSDGVTPTTQASYLTAAYKLVATNYPYVGRMFWYTLRDRDDSTPYEDGFGLLTVAGATKPSYAAFTGINSWLAAR
jgi:polysaccharide biosynthesis protein PslG